MARIPKEYKTPGGLDFSLQPYLTGGETLDIELTRQRGFQANTEGVDFAAGEKPKVTISFEEIERSAIMEKIKKTLVSLEGSTENVVQRMMDLPSTEYAFIFKAIEDTISNPSLAK